MLAYPMDPKTVIYYRYGWNYIKNNLKIIIINIIKLFELIYITLYKY